MIRSVLKSVKKNSEELNKEIYLFMKTKENIESLFGINN